MRKIVVKALAVLLIFCMLTSCATYSTLESVETRHNEVYGEGDQSMQVVEDGRFLISAEGLTIEDGVGSAVISIGNKGDRDYRFHEDSIEFFGGNKDKDRWVSLGRWSADEYYNYQYQRAQHDQSDNANALLGFMIGVSVLSTVIGAAEGDYYDFSDAFWTTLLISSAFDSIYDDDYYDLQYMEDNLLHSKTLYGREVYRGMVYFEAEEYPDYKILLHLDSGKPYEVLFQRSDREHYL